MTVSLLFGSASMALILTVCGGTEASPPSETADTLAVVEARSIPDGAVVIRPAGDQLAFENAEFTMNAGEDVTLVFENTAKSAAMGHKVVVITNEDAISRVGQPQLWFLIDGRRRNCGFRPT